MRAAAANSGHAAAPDADGVLTTAAIQEKTRPINGLRDISHLFDGVLLDQFGVLHDGKTPYRLAIEAVGQLHAAGKRVVIVSNSSRRSSGTISKLAKMGFDADWFSGAITSGELTHRYLAERPDGWWRSLGTRCIHLTWSTRGAISLKGLGLEVVGSPGEADFILAHGTEALAVPGDGAAGEARSVGLEEMRVLLGDCAAAAARRGRGMPMVVANPDIVTVDGAGGLITMPGTLAEWYRQLGGEVRLMGKPSPVIYEACAELAPEVPPGRWLAVGDSLCHDIGGAAAAGTGPSLFIVGGIHGGDAKLRGAAEAGNAGSSWDAAALESLCAEHGATPDFAAAWMQW